MNHDALLRTSRLFLVTTLLVASLTSCSSGAPESTPSTSGAPTATEKPKGCDDGNAGLTLPAGFCASVFADNLGRARHLVAASSGTVYVNTWSNMYTQMKNAPGGYVVALRDLDGDGHAEMVQRFGSVHEDGKAGGGTGIALQGDALYVEDNGKIVRYALMAGSAVPTGQPETIVSALPAEGDHPMHPFAVAPDGSLFVNSGSATNSCQQKNRTLQSPGQKPCRELATHAGIWRYDGNKTGQTFSPRERYATGLRNTVALAVQPRDGALYVAVHGRDQLSDNWPKLYTEAQQTELPAELFARVGEGADFGWPYCYFDAMQGKQVLAPEYGGDGGKSEGNCVKTNRPDVAFPAHWAPDALTFYTGTTFPAKYHGGAFIAFHGSWNRKPRQAGYLVAFVPFTDGKPGTTYEEFATGFAGAELPAEPPAAAHRPTGLALGPDGALYVSDDAKGRVWRISYAGDR
jgi:glucose/arabinose dehydrogenase